MAFSTLEQEDVIIATLAESPRVAVDIIGHSTQGRPIRLLRIGIPPPPLTQRAVLLCTGAVHGDEPAGREGLLVWAQELVDEDDPDIEEFLADHGVLIIPTVNPDGIASGTRRNGANVDIARDCLTLSQPESQALAAVLGTARPLVHLDQHEADPQLSNNVTFLHPTLAAAPPIPVARSQDLIVDLKARMTTEGWSSGDYNGLDSEQVPRNAASLRHCAGTLVETSVGGAGQTEELRTEQQRVCAEETLLYCVEHVDTMFSEVATSEADVTAEGAAGTTPFDLRVATLDPPPLGYRLTGLVPQLHLSAFNITLAPGVIVRMDQPAQRAIPFLFDPAAATPVNPALQLFTLTPQVIVPTVQQLAPIVAGSHHPVFEAILVDGFQSGPEPTGTPLVIRDGDVTFDATADVHGTLSLTVAAVDEQTGRSLFPRRAPDLLAPYGREVFVRRGVDLGGAGIMWSPLGYFRLTIVEQGDTSDAPLTLAGSDRMWLLQRSNVLVPQAFPPETTFAEFVAALVGAVHPQAVVAFDDDTAFEPIGRQLVVDESRYDPLREVADGLGKIMWWDGEGVLRIESGPDEQTPVWRVAAGRGGVLIESSRRVSTESAFNAVVVIGTGGDVDPVQGQAVDVGPLSPTRWGGDFGRIPHRVQLPTVNTTAQAADAAREILRRNLGAAYSADFGAVVNPALRPRMPVLVVQGDGNREVHVMQSVTIPLVAGAAMTGTTRERTNVVIGSVIS